MAQTTEIAAVILDMDGLMLDTESIYKRAWQSAADECGYSLDDSFYLTLIGLPNPACEAALLERYGGAGDDRWADLHAARDNALRASDGSARDRHSRADLGAWPGRWMAPR